MKISIAVQNLTKKYGFLHPHHALRGLSFQVFEGRTCGLLGPNGAGKTTVFNAILGLIRPTSGELKVLGVSKLKAEDREHIGFLPEESYLYPFLTVRETLEFAADLYPNSKSLRSKIPDVLELVELTHATSRKISQCSKGMRRRTALAQTLLHDPSLIILDEPTSGFDPMGIAMMKSIIGDLHAQGKTILLCSHQLKEVQDLCQDVVILSNGKAVASGSMDELVPDNRWGVECSHEHDLLRVKDWMSEQGMYVKSFAMGDLEKFFIDTVKGCS